FQRAMDKLPRQGSREPWRIHQNYLRDVIALRLAPIADGVLRFSARHPPAGDEAPGRPGRMTEGAAAT
ncbi:MAG TPA: hypothetical protein VFA64_00005, partial [Hyphomicrobiaceae bacterium]|nr:hypothetical protein [Hyphomicrobiaceae bacterium]